MRFLADESCDFSVVRALREAGYDVQAVKDASPRADDEQVAQIAIGDQRILLTEDKDFGQIIFAAGKRPPGVIFMRFPGNRRRSLVAAVLELLEKVGEGITGRFVVLQPGRVRITQRPE